MRVRWYAYVSALIALIAATSLIVVFFRADRRTDENATTLVALCALRDDIDLRIESSTKFLAEHPQGIPGIPASLIRQGLVNSKRTRTTLNVLDC
jgi:hypothetical protein